MGKIVSNFFMALDGVVEAPDQWHFPYFDDRMGAVIQAGVESTAAFLMGRVLYGEWSEFWPAQQRTKPDAAVDTANDFGAFINNVPKYVVSNTLRDATWNNTTIVAGDVAGRLRDIKDRTDGDITMSGSATLVRFLLGEGLLDELHVLVHPIVVGHGRRLFENPDPCPLRLVGHEVFDTGVLNLSYAPA